MPLNLKQGKEGTAMGTLDGKVAIVTGAARGLGRAYAKRLAGLEAKVAVADLNLHSYEEFEAEAKDMTADSTVAEIEASGGTALGIEVDVRDHEAVEAMVARVVQESGRVDLLVANAGGGRGRPVDTKASTLDPALLQLVTEMNLFGTVYSCNAVAPVMKQQRFGKIITVSASLNKAFQVVAKAAGQNKLLIKGEKEIKNVWARFRNSAHLAASFLLTSISREDDVEEIVKI